MSKTKQEILKDKDYFAKHPEITTVEGTID